MRVFLGVCVALSLSCGSVAYASSDHAYGDRSSNYQTYSGIPVDTDPVILARFDRAQRHCEPEADSWRRGSPDRHSLLHITALKSCLSRRNFIDRGAYAYPSTPLGFFEHFLDR
jgi:hypothetical protein